MVPATCSSAHTHWGSNLETFRHFCVQTAYQFHRMHFYTGTMLSRTHYNPSTPSPQVFHCAPGGEFPIAGRNRHLALNTRAPYPGCTLQVVYTTCRPVSGVRPGPQCCTFQRKQEDIRNSLSRISMFPRFRGHDHLFLALPAAL